VLRARLATIGACPVSEGKVLSAYAARTRTHTFTELASIAGSEQVDRAGGLINAHDKLEPNNSEVRTFVFAKSKAEQSERQPLRVHQGMAERKNGTRKRKN